jgi:FdhD protein
MEPSLAPTTTTAPVTRFTGPHREDAHDHLAVEEPLQIRLAGEDVAVTMRTPGHDHELAAGFLFTEGIIAGHHHIENITHCPDTLGNHDNIVNVQPTERALLEPHAWGSRNFYSTSSCGLCGKTSIEQITAHTAHLNPNPAVRVNLQTLYTLPDKLRAAQATFARTGGVHAAALFDLHGELLFLREDVGRHNAVDKVIGHAILNDLLPLNDRLLLVSSRASFEIVQKALAAGISVLAVVSAPSSLAVDLARQVGMTLVAFLQNGRLNVYAGEERVEPGA